MRNKPLQGTPRTVMHLDRTSKFYHMGDSTVTALNNITLTIREGEFLIILGPSGSGKSTMMHLLGCLDYPSTGNLFLDKQNVRSLSESNLATIRGQKIGFIFQQFNLIPTLTALENVMLPLEFQEQHTETDIRKKARSVLALVGLKDRAHHYPNQLSGGQMQRVAIARALINDPEIILADEPTGNLDTKTGDIIISFLKKLHKEQHKTIIIVTHDTDLVNIGTRVIRLRDGTIIGGIKK